MGCPVLIYGKSGAGKSRSLKNFADSEVAVVKCINKPFPFKNKLTHVLQTMDINEILKYIKRAAKNGVKSIVIDDAGYIMTAMYMSGNNSGGNKFDLFNNIGNAFWVMVNFIMSIEEDVIVYIIMHEESSDDGTVKLRTIGKLLDQKVCLEGMVTIVLHAVVDDDGRHVFRTQANKNDIAKSPEDMFEDTIENDLKAVDVAIRSYYGFGDASK